MEKLEYMPRKDIAPLAQEVVDFLKPKELPVWQVKEILREAVRLAEWQTMK